ncbi:MAG: SAM-dependent methyltransferase [Alphaproteobacteria bacterium]
MTSRIAQWDERFATDDFVFGREPNAFLRRAATHIAPGGSVLAVADGEGRNGVWLARQGFRVHAVDGSAVALAKSEKFAAEHGVTLRVERADLTLWCWPEAAYDAVVAIFIQFATAEEQPALFAGMARALKPGGVLLLEGYRPKQLEYGTGGPKQVENLYTRELLEAVFAALQILELREYDAVIEEGGAHSGMSALIDLVARRPA